MKSKNKWESKIFNSLSTDWIIHIKRYSFAYLLIFLYFPGGLVTDFAIIVTSLWAFSYFLIKRELDLFLIFLFLVPSIVFNSSSGNVNDINEHNLFSNYRDVIFLGPVALSTPLALVLALPFRLLSQFTKTNNSLVISLWLFVVFLSVIGLLLAYNIGTSNDSGLTVGLRYVLSIGTVLLPLSIKDKDSFYHSIDKIFLISFFFLVFGLISGHWIFVIFGFIPYVFHRNHFIIRILICYFSLLFFINFSSTITILGIFVSSVIFYLTSVFGNIKNNVLRRPIVQCILILSPIIFTTIILLLNVEKIEYDKSSSFGYTFFKIFSDRKPIWNSSFDQIVNSPIFIVPAGSSLNVYFDYLDTSVVWQPGSHNIFLEIGRQNGVFAMVVLVFILVYVLIKTGKSLSNKDDLILYYSFISVYIIFSTTGNSLIISGVGFFYWLLLGQFNRIVYSEAKISTK